MRSQTTLSCRFVLMAIIAATMTVGLPFGADAQSSGAAGPAVTLRGVEHKSSKHPTKTYYVSIWPDGPQVSFQNKYGILRELHVPQF